MNIPKMKKVNTKNVLDLVVNKLLFLILYKKFSKKIVNKIKNLIDIIKEILTDIVNGRKFARIRKKPNSKWSKYGNAFKIRKK